MSRRTLLAVSAGLTAFVLILAGAVASWALQARPAAADTPGTQEQAPAKPPAYVPSVRHDDREHHEPRHAHAHAHEHEHEHEDDDG